MVQQERWMQPDIKDRGTPPCGQSNVPRRISSILDCDRHKLESRLGDDYSVTDFYIWDHNTDLGVICEGKYLKGYFRTKISFFDTLKRKINLNILAKLSLKSCVLFLRYWKLGHFLSEWAWGRQVSCPKCTLARICFTFPYFSICCCWPRFDKVDCFWGFDAINVCGKVTIWIHLLVGYINQWHHVCLASNSIMVYGKWTT